MGKLRVNTLKGQKKCMPDSVNKYFFNWYQKHSFLKIKISELNIF